MPDGYTMHTAADAPEAPWPAADLALAASETLPPPPLPLSLFPRAWVRWIERAADSAGAPADYVACGLLAVAGATIGNARWGSPWQGWQHPPVINLACVGTPSAGKSPAINTVTGPLSELVAEMNADWEDRQRQFRTARQEAKEHRARWESEVKEAVKNGLAPPMEPPTAKEPQQLWKRRAHSTDPTVEAARDLSRANPRGLLLHRDELVGWIASMGRYGAGSGGGTADRSFWLQAYEGSRWTSDRVKDGDDGADIPHLTWGILGGVQPDRLASVILAGDDDGLAARFIYTWPNTPPGKPKRPSGDGLPFLLMPALRRLRELPMPNGEPVTLTFSAEAADLFDEWRGEVKEMEADAAGLFLSWIGKLPGMTVRLAVIFAHLDWLAAPDGTPPPDHISADAVVRAQGFLADYAVPMAKRAFGEAALPEAERDARRLARWMLRQRPRRAVLNARQMRREANGPGIVSAPRIEAALQELAALGWVRPSDSKAGGRRRADWDVHPAVREAG
ncbi:DUF3987 domain-containing protein [Roseomonas sp. M0104]|uniref:DUF3987 domain-containing protein n=1 Tax=Teichococcus coralli TaxID=2545983 RepID=A0A845B9S1_9PROT|nr:DUF3987 domain-containing protein [Pseudoroseomonas coralli]MXP62132.1 DUF3987 domain-containing protein [Pseudoroseomonas coralli]